MQYIDNHAGIMFKLNFAILQMLLGHIIDYKTYTVDSA